MIILYACEKCIESIGEGRELNTKKMIVHIDKYGDIVKEPLGKYKVTLSGSYSWCFLANCWKYEVKDIFPKMPLSYILNDAIL